MPVASRQRSVLRSQPLNQKRLELNPAHWLAGRIIFVHSGQSAFVWEEPASPIEKADFPPVKGARTATTTPNALDSALNLLPNGAAFETYDTGSHPALGVSLSVWINRDANSGTGQYYLTSTSTVDSTTLRIQQAGINNSILGGTSTRTWGAALTWNTKSWRNTVISAVSTVNRRGWADGANRVTDTASRGSPTHHNRICVGRTLSGTTYGDFIGAGVSAMALPMVVEGVFEDDEVARLYEEQRTNPWQLFRERPQQIWLGVAAAPTLPTLSLPTAIDITATSLKPRVTYAY